MAKPFEVGKTYKDTSNANIRILANDYIDIDLKPRLVGLVSSPNGSRITLYEPTGKAWYGFPSLVPEKEKLEGWVKVWRGSDGHLFFGGVNQSETEARKSTKSNGGNVVVDVVKVEYEG